MKSTDPSGVRRISANLPKELIEGVDQLKKEWGLRSRGAVIERLLEDVFSDISTTYTEEVSKHIENKRSELSKDFTSPYNEDKAIVLIGNSSKDITIESTSKVTEESKSKPTDERQSINTGIDLPGFVRTKTSRLRSTLKQKEIKSSEFDSYINTVKKSDIEDSLKTADDHWYALYGNNPAENVIEAAMKWLARDIWPHVEGTEESPFTWSGANKLMNQYCKSWKYLPPKLDRIIVTAGVLEDPFSSDNLKNRVPTIIRRFVNNFKRRQNITSFQTIESTMTVHGALKLLGIPTLAGQSLTLRTIRDAYKDKAMQSHPDSGGSNELMRKLNEAYQLLKDLYK